MARDNPVWGQEQIAAELLIKLGIQVSPRTVQKYLLRDPSNRQRGVPSQRWMTFVRNHAKAIVACDFLVSVTVHFRVIYVFLIMEVGTRRLIHFNVTSHLTAAWTIQQFCDTQLEEASKCYLYGFYRVAVVLSACFFGRGLKDTLDLDRFERYEELVDRVRCSGRISNDLAEAAKQVFRKRNAVVHSNLNPSDDEAMDALSLARTVVSHIRLNS